MELFRVAARATTIVFPLLDFENRPRTGATSLDSEWIAWSDGVAPGNGNNFADMTAEATEIYTSGTYSLAVAAGELPAASPYVMIRVISANAATQYILIRTASVYANVQGWNGTDVIAPNTAGVPRVDLDLIEGVNVSTTTAQLGVNVVTLSTGAIASGSFSAGAIDAAAIAADAIGASEIAANAIGASELASDVITDIWQGTALTEGYAADGATATPAQLLYMIWSALAEFAISGTTVTARQLDGTTAAMTFTLDSSTSPTSRTRAT